MQTINFNLQNSDSDSGVPEQITLQNTETISDSKTQTKMKNEFATLPTKLENLPGNWDELDNLLQIERHVDDKEKLYQTMPPGVALEPFNVSNNVNSKQNSTDFGLYFL